VLECRFLTLLSLEGVPSVLQHTGGRFLEISFDLLLKTQNTDLQIIMIQVNLTIERLLKADSRVVLADHFRASRRFNLLKLKYKTKEKRIH
jgi:hypothetical protein